jgi:hypothetical protein
MKIAIAVPKRGTRHLCAEEPSDHAFEEKPWLNELLNHRFALTCQFSRLIIETAGTHHTIGDQRKAPKKTR